MPQVASANRKRKGSIIRTWELFRYQGRPYSLDHLAQFEWVFIQPAKAGKPEQTYRFVVEFGLHCFTRGPNTHRGEGLHHVDKALHYRDSRETRIFCFERYKLSFKLPEIAKSLSERFCSHTGKGNFFVIEPVDIGGERKAYEVYFQVSKTSKKSLRLYVQTAYIRNRERESSQPRWKKINFFTIAHNTRIGKKTRVPN